MTTPPLQQHEIDAWLGDDHGLTAEQVVAFHAAAEDIHARYPEDDDAAEREAAMIAAHRVLSGDTTVEAELAASLLRSRQAALLATAGLRQVARMTITPSERGRKGPNTENAFAVRVGVDRMTVRDWLGKGKTKSD